jgi:hypothetical protein
MWLYLKNIYNTTIHNYRLEEHKRNFQPVLDELLSVLKEKQEPQNKRDALDFFYRDLESLVTSTPSSTEPRKAFIERTLDKTIPIKDLQVFKKEISVLSREDTLEKVSELRDIVHTKPTEISTILDDSKIFFDEQKFICSEKYLMAVDLLAKHIHQSSEMDLDVFIKFSEYYEKAALILTEPFFCAILGNAVLLSVILPLHKRGVFSKFVSNTAERVKELESQKNSFWSIPNFLTRVKPFVTKNPYSTTFASLGTFYAFRVFKISPHIKSSLGLTQILANKALTGEGFNNAALNIFKANLTKLCFEAGQTLSSLTQGFAQGFLSKYTETLKDIAPFVDNYLKNRRGT